MTTTSTVFVVLALVAAGLVAVQAVRHPILWRMAARNAGRRPRQTATVIAGLMVGTAIISAALVAGSSAGSAIRGAVFDALGDTDETLRTDGFYFWPESVAIEIADDPRMAFFDGVAPFALWGVAAEHESGTFEPSVSLVGYDLQRDADFGTFHLTDGSRISGSGLGPDDAIATADLAEALDLRAGDRVTVKTTVPADPLLPTFQLRSGTIAASIDPALPLLPPAAQERDEHTFTVDRGSTSATIILLCGNPLTNAPCPQGTSLSAIIESPDGTQWTVDAPFPQTAQGCQAGACPPEAYWTNITAPTGAALTTGDWTVTVTGRAAVQAPYLVVTAVLRPVYDLDELAKRAAALEDQAADLLGDQLDLDLFGERAERTFTVVAIADGGRANMFGLGSALFAPLPTVQTFLEREGQVNFLKFSNPGSATEGHVRTDEAVLLINATLDDARERHPGILVLDHLEVNPVKQDFLRIADQAGELLTSLLIFAGSLTITTGLLLIINIFTMLAEERRSELGMARAVGLRRLDLVRTFLFEGSLYAVAAAFIGSILGLGLAYGLIALLNNILVRLEASFPPIPFDIPAGAVPVAFSVGLVLTFATILVASIRQSRLNIVRAIRQIDEPENAGPRWSAFVGWPLAVIGVGITVFGWVALWLLNADPSLPRVPSLWFIVFGPVGIGVGIALPLRQRWPRVLVDTAVAGALGIYYIVTMFTITEFPDLREANIVGPIRGVLLTLCVVLIVTYWRWGPRALGRVLARFRRLRAVAVPAMSYPQHKRFRTGMTLAMFSIVILSIGFFSIFGALFDLPAERQTGGFHIEATTTLDVPGLEGNAAFPVQGIRSEHRLLDQFSFDPDFITVNGEGVGSFGPPGHHVYGVDQAFVDAQSFDLLWAIDDLDDSAVYQRLLDEPGTVIVSYPYSTDDRNQDLAHDVGDTLHIHIGECTINAGTCPEFTIIGIQEQWHFPGIFLPAQVVEDMFPQADSLYLFKIDDPSNAIELAQDLERSYRSIGMNALSSVDEVEKEQEGFRQILAAMKLFLGLGLIVGVLSLGIVTSRSVLERRQEIGMLRALGFTAKQTRRIFLIEVTLIIFMGFIIGLLCSIIVTFGLWFAVIRELQYPYTIPWSEIGLLFLVSYIVAMLATIAPIVKVGRVAPAEALRYVE